MDRTETQTNSFIIRIWLEEQEDEGAEALWRGHVTHVPSGKRQYFQELKEICVFVALYLQKMGVGAGSIDCLTDERER